jgi:hypothetical protein
MRSRPGYAPLMEENDVGVDPEQAISDEAREDRQVAEQEVADRAAGEDEPHSSLSNPVDEPDPTEPRDPYERGEDEPDEPHPPRNIDRLREGEGEG